MLLLFLRANRSQGRSPTQRLLRPAHQTLMIADVVKRSERGSVPHSRRDSLRDRWRCRHDET